MRWMAWLLVVLGAVSCGPDEGPVRRPRGRATSGTWQGSATIRGRILFLGEPPSRRSIDPGGERGLVPAPLQDDGILVNEDRSLWDAIVYVESEALERHEDSDVLSTPVLFEAADGVYRPHALAVMVDQPLQYENRDGDHRHNPHFFAEDPF